MSGRRKEHDSAVSTSECSTKFKRRPGANTSYGFDYEVQLVALLFIRGLSSKCDFKLSSNRDGLDAFDDVIFEYKNVNGCWKRCLFQLKHKAKGGNIQAMSLKADTGDFSVKEHFTSFERIACDLSDSILILFTNACLPRIDENEEHKMHFKNIMSKDCSGDVDDLINLNNDTQYICDLSEWDDCLQNEEAEVRSVFLNQFKIFSGMPNVQGLSRLVTEEVCKTCNGRSNVQIEKIKGKYLAKVEKWCSRTGQCYFLDNTVTFLEESVCEVEMDDEHEKEMSELRLNMHFDQFCLGDLTDVLSKTLSLAIITYPPNSSLKIHLTKLIQVLDDCKRTYRIVNFKRSRVVEHLKLWRRSEEVLLLIAEPDVKHRDEITSALDEMCEFLTKNKDVRVGLLLLSPQNCVFRVGLEDKLKHNYYKLEDNFHICQLSEDSHERLVSCTVNFQGHFIPKKEIISEELCMEMSMELHLFIVENGGYQIGKDLPKLPSFYIDRTLLRQNCVKKIIFECSYLQDTYAVSGLTPFRFFGEFWASNRTRSGKEGSPFVTLDPSREEEHFKEVCQRHKNVHWLQNTKSGLFWRRTHGSIREVIDYLEDNVKLTGSPKDLLGSEDRVVVLSAEPGMGKSTLMAALASQTKKRLPSDWVILAELRDYYKNLEMEVFNEMEVFCRMATHDNSSCIERELLTHAMNCTGKIHVFFDGYDEIPETCIKNFKKLLKYLLNTKVNQIWVSTRCCVEKDLLLFFNTTSHSLSAFSKDDQINFFLKYWNYAVEESVIKKIIELLNSTINDWEKDWEKEFTVIPLQCSMIGEIYKDDPTLNVEAISANFDIARMYDIFVQKKYRIAYEEKNGFSVGFRPHLFKRFCKEACHNHTAASMVFLLDKTFLASLNGECAQVMSDEFVNEIEKGEENIGIIDRIHDTPNFVHRTYAEYYFGKWLAENFRHNRIFIEEHLYKQSMNVVRCFFDRFLSRGHKLHVAVLGTNHNQVEMLLRSGAQVDSRDEAGRTALHLCAAVRCDGDRRKDNMNIISTLVEFDARVDGRDELLHWSPLRYADHVGAYDVLEFLLPRAGISKDDLIETRNIVAKQEDYLGLDLMNNSSLEQKLLDIIEFGGENVMRFLLENGMNKDFILKSFLSECSLLQITADYGNMKIMNLLIEQGSNMRALNNQNQTPLHFAAKQGHANVVNLLIKNISNDKEDVVRYINQKDEMKMTALDWGIAMGYIDVVRLLLEAGADLSKHNNFTPLHTAARYGDSDILDLLINHISKDDAEVETYVNQKDERGYTAMHYGTKYPGIVTRLVMAGADVTLTTDLDHNNSTALMEAAMCDSLCTVELIIGHLEESGSALAPFINMQNSQGDSAAIIASRRGHHLMLRFLEQKGADLTLTNICGQTVLHVMVHTRFDVVEEILDIVKESLSSSWLSLLQVPDSKGCTALHLAVQNNHLDAVRVLLSVGRSHLSLLKARTNEGYTVLHEATFRNHLDIVRVLLGNEETRMPLLETRDSKSCTALHLATSLKHLDVVRELVSVIRDSCVSLLAAEDKEGRTPLHVAVSCDSLEIVQVLLSVQESRVALLEARDSDGCTVLHLAVCLASLQIVEELLSVQEMRVALLKARDSEGCTVLHLAVCRASLEIVEKLLDVEEMRVALLEGRNNRGCTALHFAVSLPLVSIELVKKLLSVKETHVSLLKARNYMGCTALECAQGLLDFDRFTLACILFPSTNMHALHDADKRCIREVVEFLSSVMSTITES